MHTGTLCVFLGVETHPLFPLPSNILHLSTKGFFGYSFFCSHRHLWIFLLLRPHLPSCIFRLTSPVLQPDVVQRECD
jgi:hypothetical protein